MIHNKYFHILKQYLGDYNRVIYGRELVGKIPLSQKAIALALEQLEKKGILKSHKKGTLKLYELNKDYSEIYDILALAEIARKGEFLSKHRVLAHIFKSDSRIVGIFGSYAKGIQKKDSDIDVFIIGKKKDEEYDKIGKKFDKHISIKYFSQKQFTELMKMKNNLCKEIIKNHVLLFNIEQFIKLIAEEYYGFKDK